MANNQNKRGGSNITLIVQDEGWNKLATFKWNSANKAKQSSIIRTLDDAFGIKHKSKSDTSWMMD